ncbi:MAG: hypothetical protein K2W33_02505 [Burkholderiales bacterium]|nr:hypothetical protein [Burkholderiales bacterium]
MLTTTDDTGEAEPVQTPRLWQGDGWTAKVIKNEDDDGWAVEMMRDGEREPALVAPWTMGRDKKNPKPLDSAAFYTWVKTANEVVRRHEQQLHALLHKSVKLSMEGEPIEVMLDITPDDDAPYAVLSAHDRFGECLAQVTVDAGFKLNDRSAEAWVRQGYKAPARAHAD